MRQQLIRSRREESTLAHSDEDRRLQASKFDARKSKGHRETSLGSSHQLPSSSDCGVNELHDCASQTANALALLEASCLVLRLKLVEDRASIQGIWFPLANLILTLASRNARLQSERRDVRLL